jgi:hypothetical protein
LKGQINNTATFDNPLKTMKKAKETNQKRQSNLKKPTDNIFDSDNEEQPNPKTLTKL